MGKKKKILKGGVKIMLSYNYCHFEVCLGDDTLKTLKEINEMRKDAQRLADEAVRQYKVAKQKASMFDERNIEYKNLKRQVEIIANKPKSEWTVEDKAKVKALADKEYWETRRYDFNDEEELDW